MRNTKPTTNKPRLIKKKQQQGEKLKGELKFACDQWKYWKSQINWENWNM